jgi:hypothetical protein
MKTKNMRDLEKHWADQQKKAAKAAKQPKPAPRKKSREDQAASEIVPEVTKD